MQNMYSSVEIARGVLGLFCDGADRLKVLRVFGSKVMRLLHVITSLRQRSALSADTGSIRAVALGGRILQIDIPSLRHLACLMHL